MALRRRAWIGERAGETATARADRAGDASKRKGFNAASSASPCGFGLPPNWAWCRPVACSQPFAALINQLIRGSACVVEAGGWRGQKRRGKWSNPVVLKKKAPLCAAACNSWPAPWPWAGAADDTGRRQAGRLSAGSIGCRGGTGGVVSIQRFDQRRARAFGRQRQDLDRPLPLGARISLDPNQPTIPLTTPTQLHFTPSHR